MISAKEEEIAVLKNLFWIAFKSRNLKAVIYFNTRLKKISWDNV